MKTSMRALVAIAVLAVGATVQLSCSVNDYCLHCEDGDGGMGSGSNDGGDGGGGSDAMDDAGCIPTGPEECDGKDNNCNGLTDEEPIAGVGVLCSNQNGACAGGVTVCSAGVIKCDKQGAPETCNGLDDNCSGAPDEGDPGGGGKCGTDLGECVAGQYHCNAASGTVTCFGFVDHTMDPELCDAKDNDCDGNFDENVVITPSACGPTTNNGECNIGSLQCQAGTQICTGAVFPKFETCNLKDDDCDNNIDEIYNKQTDIQNCGTCGTVCQPTSKTCINTNNNTNGTTCTADSQCPGGTCAVNSQPRCIAGGCTFACNAGFQNKDLMATNGCEFHCFATGAEVCDGADNDCDGNVDESLTPPALCLAGGECGATAPVAQCTGAGGWTCTYLGDVQFPETLCDGKNNDCDANIDEAQTNLGNGVGLGQTCSVVPETVCGAAVDNDNDGFTNDGCPAVGAAETACNDNIDNDLDGSFNDGCPAREERGLCKSTGTYTCDPMNLNGPPKCTITMPGANPDPNETCDAKDNDCDGKTDEGGATGGLIGQEWVDLGDGKQMMKYEASKPDATATAQGTAKASDATDTSAFTCSRAGVQPWTNLKYADAAAACAKIGASLCSEVQWHRACSAVTPVTYPVTAPGTGTFIEAENYQSTTFSGSFSWVEDYTSTFSGIGDVEATPNLGTSVSAANAVAQSPHVDFQVAFGATSSTWHVWVKVFANNAANDAVLVGVNGATPVATTTFPSGNFNTWQWLDATLPGSVSGTQTIRVYMGDDGVKIDKIYIFNGTTTASAVGTADTINSKGGKWAYATGTNTYQGTTCNGDDFDTSAAAGDQDDILTTGALASCKSTTGTGIFDMSGNVKEWTRAHVPGENPIRGGASNNTGEGISCPLNFTLADDTFFFPNIGFRCCR